DVEAELVLVADATDDAAGAHVVEVGAGGEGGEGALDVDVGRTTLGGAPLERGRSGEGREQQRGGRADHDRSADRMVRTRPRATPARRARTEARGRARGGARA